MNKLILITLTAIFSIAFLLMLAICITMKVEYWGQHKGTEASGFDAAAVLITIMVAIPTAILWFVLLKKKNKTRDD
ncbi:MAG: hypothetical protein ABI402_13995 [Ferruginibacter sp.]